MDVLCGYGTTFDRAGSCKLIITLLEMLVLIIVHHLGLRIGKIILLVLGESPTFGFNGTFDLAMKKFSINFSKANSKFCLSFHYNADNNYLFVNGKEIFKFKSDNKMLTLQLNFVSKAYLRDIVLLNLDKNL